MRNSFFTITLLSALTFQSCSSTFYKEKNRIKNNTITVKANYSDFSIASKRQSLGMSTKYETTLNLTPLTRKNSSITFSRQDCYDTTIQVKRTIRLGAVLADIPLSVFYGVPFLIDVFRPDFYKVSRDYKTIELNFKKTDEYFKRKVELAIKQSKSSGWTFENRNKNLVLTTPPTQHEFNSILILDSLFQESPSEPIYNYIELNKFSIINSFLSRSIANNDLSWRGYNALNLKYRVYDKNQINIILDSLRLVATSNEITALNNSKDLLNYLTLYGVADPLFKVQLSNLRPEIETAFLNDISRDFNFGKLSALENQDTSSVKRVEYNSFRTSLEKKFTEQLTLKYDNNLFEQNYRLVSSTTQRQLDLIKKRVNDETLFTNVKLQIEEVDKLILFGELSEALSLISQINLYKNNLPYTSPKKEVLDPLLTSINDKLKPLFISECISYINSETEHGRYPIDEIDAFLKNSPIYDSNNSRFTLEIQNNDITPTQRNQLKKLKKILTENREIEIKNEQLEREESQKRAAFKYNKNCSWCNKSFSGDHYTHMGKLADCYSTSQAYTINTFCSMSCCSASRRRGSGNY
jgi:hypothetical protein